MTKFLVYFVMTPAVLYMAFGVLTACRGVWLEHALSGSNRKVARLAAEVVELRQDETQYKRAFDELSALDETGRRQWVMGVTSASLLASGSEDDFVIDGGR